MPAFLPSYFASQALFSTYYLALPDDYPPLWDDADVTDEAFRTAEMDALMALVPRDETTKLFAVVSGNWNTAGNWYPSGVPGANAKVCIPEGCTCTYDKNDSTTKIFTIRLDGNLYSDPTIDTALVFDTWIITQTGLWRDGTRTTLVANDVEHLWMIATSNGLVDVSWDTFFQSRGIISQGRVDLWGQWKTPYLEVASYTGPMAGATSLTLASPAVNWQPNDEVVICATHYNGFELVFVDDGQFGSYYNHPPYQSEERTIATISPDGLTITWTGGLTYNHDGPQGTTGRTDCKAYVGNLTRNVRVTCDDEATPIHHRGHTMQMHQPDGWNMHNAEFSHIGRTAKHNWLFSKIYNNKAATTAGNSLDLSASPYWDGTKITFGPTFTIDYAFVTPNSGTCTITGTDKTGAAKTFDIVYTANVQASGTIDDYFLTVTDIKFTTDIAITETGKLFSINARSRQMNENGVRTFPGLGIPPTYAAVHNTDNLQGRYPVHFHKIGLLGDILKNPPLVSGCSIHDSPGWLLAQHQSHLNVVDFVGYNSPGAGLVGEDGNETGLWLRCLSTQHCGTSDFEFKAGPEAIHKDPGRTGASFWFTGRMIRTKDCVHVACQGGQIFNVRVNNILMDPQQMDQPTAGFGKLSAVNIDDPPIAHNEGNQFIACEAAQFIVKAEPAQQHDLRTVLKNAKIWSAAIGQEPTYTMHYTMLGTSALHGHMDGFFFDQAGLQLGTSSSDQVWVDCISEGWNYGIGFNHTTTGGEADDPLNGRIDVNSTLRDNAIGSYSDFNADIDSHLSTGDLNLSIRPSVSLSINPTTRTITGTKTDEMGTCPFPMGFDYFSFGNYLSEGLTTFGYYVDTDGEKYMPGHVWFSSRLTGILDLVVFPVNVTAIDLTGKTNHGSSTIANDTPPVLADFTVSATRNTNLEIDVAARATGTGVKFAGKQGTMLGTVVENGDGTVTYVPLADANYSESFYVWVQDANFNNTRALCTVNVNKRAIFLGRADLLAT